MCFHNAVFCFFSPHPAGSVHATSIAASRVEQALSEVASSLQSSAPKHGPLHPWMTLAQIWLHAGLLPHIFSFIEAESVVLHQKLLLEVNDEPNIKILLMFLVAFP